MTILHVISGLPKAAGTSVFAGELASQQAADGHNVTILVKVRATPEQPVSDKVEIISATHHSSLVTHHSFDIVHLHAIWDPWLTKMARHFRKQGAKIVWSPHGMLTLWALKNKWPKKLAGLLAYQYWSLRKADLIHVTADSEVEDVRRLCLLNPIVLAPLGVHIKKNNNSTVRLQHSPSPKSKYIAFVSRVQRKKGLPNLVKAWAKLPAELKVGWKIKIAGPDQDNHLSELYALCASLHIPYTPAPQQKGDNSTVHLHLSPSPQILFLGPVYDEAKDKLYAEAAFSVLPTHSENFGSVVIESLAQGTPVICTKGAPWRDLVDYNCGQWINIGVEPLVNALTEYIQLFNLQPLTFDLLGQRGEALVQEKYTWPAVAKTMEDAYAKLLC